MASLRRGFGRHSRPVVTPNGTYADAATAARAYGVAETQARARLARGTNGWRYTEAPKSTLPPLNGTGT